MTAAPNDVDDGLSLDEHRAVCRDRAACLICLEDEAPKGAK